MKPYRSILLRHPCGGILNCHDESREFYVYFKTSHKQESLTEKEEEEEGDIDDGGHGVAAASALKDGGFNWWD